MIRSIIVITAIVLASLPSARAENGAGTPAAADADEGVARLRDLDDSSTVFARSDENWLNAGAIASATSDSDEPNRIATNVDALELFPDESAETPQPEETPMTPDAVFNSTASDMQSFHRFYEPPWRQPYRGPARQPQPYLGTTNTWLPNPCEGSHGNFYQDANGSWLGSDRYCDVSGTFNDPYNTALRFGWWGINNDGALSKVGMYQDLESSPFWDVDMVRSDGQRTVDFWMSGLDEDANAAQANFYAGPGFWAKLRYQGYLRNLGHDPLYGAPITGPLGPDDNVVTEDLNVGKDYAIRVQQLDVRFAGRINENLKWRVNVWSQRKFGERQANATAHCFNVNEQLGMAGQNNVCHVLSQRQNIDWRTFQIQPVLEANLGILNAEYSHTLRTFGQNDQIVTRQYTRFGYEGPGGRGTLGDPLIYAFVPDNTFNVDRLKLGLNFNEANQMYGNFYYGYSEDEFRETSRQYSGFDVRYTNRSFDQLTTTAYVNMNADNMSNVPFLLADEIRPDEIRHPVDHTWTRAGIKWNWQPIEDLKDRFSIASGYEYYLLNRQFAVYPTALGTFHQPDTSSNMIEFSPQMRWSRSLYSFVRYKAYFVNDPIIGVRENNGRFNTNQPTQQHRVEIGGWWSPTTNFMTTAQFGINDSWHKSGYADFSENSYPFSWTMWYAPTEKLSISGGYGYYSNWIDQDITLGFRFNAFPDQTETTRWNYAGENHVANINLAYTVSPTIQLVAGYEYNFGNNVFNVPASPAGADWSQLASFSNVKVEQNRVTAGADWQPFDNTTLYLRYIYFDFNDIGSGIQSGTTHMALAGAGVVF